MKTIISVLIFCWTLGEALGARNAIEIVTDHLTYSIDPATPQGASLLREASSIIEGDQGLQSQIESEDSRAPVHDALLWAASSHSAFKQETFASSYPALFGYAHVMLVSPDMFNAPRLIYLLPGDAPTQPRMLYEDSKKPSVAEFVRIPSWNDPEQISDWIGDYTFEDTDKGPYLVNTSIGRETTGATSIRHVLGWIRIEATKLVPERFEAYDVPLGKKRQIAYLKTTATPALPSDSEQNVPNSPKSKSIHPSNPSEQPLRNRPKQAEQEGTVHSPISQPSPFTAQRVAAVITAAVVIGLLYLVLKNRR